MSNEKQEKSEEPKAQQPKMRQVIIEFDTQRITIVKAEISSNWELESILRKLLKQLNV